MSALRWLTALLGIGAGAVAISRWSMQPDAQGKPFTPTRRLRTDAIINDIFDTVDDSPGWWEQAERRDAA